MSMQHIDPMPSETIEGTDRSWPSCKHGHILVGANFAVRCLCIVISQTHFIATDSTHRTPSLASAHTAANSAERQTGESVSQTCQQSRTTSQRSLMGRCRTALAGMAPTSTTHRRCACLSALYARQPGPRPSPANVLSAYTGAPPLPALSYCVSLPPPPSCSLVVHRPR